MARQSVEKWSNFVCHMLHNQCLLGFSTTDFSNIGDVPKHLDYNFRKRIILTSKSHKLENFLLSPAVAMIPNIQWKIAVTLFTNLAFVKLSRPYPFCLKKKIFCCFQVSLPTHRVKRGAILFCHTPF